MEPTRIVARKGFVDALVSKPDEVPEVKLISGYRGASGQKGTSRLYLDEELTSFVEFSDKDVLHEERLPVEVSPLGEVAVWLRKDAPVRNPKLESAVTGFLRGEITEAHLGGSVVGYTPNPDSTDIWCPRTGPILSWSRIRCGPITTLPTLPTLPRPTRQFRCSWVCGGTFDPTIRQTVVRTDIAVGGGGFAGMPTPDDDVPRWPRTIASGGRCPPTPILDMGEIAQISWEAALNAAQIAAQNAALKQRVQGR